VLQWQVDSECEVSLLEQLVSLPTTCEFVQHSAELSVYQILPCENNGHLQLYTDQQLSVLIAEQMLTLLMQMDAVRTPVVLFWSAHLNNEKRKRIKCNIMGGMYSHVLKIYINRAKYSTLYAGVCVNQCCMTLHLDSIHMKSLCPFSWKWKVLHMFLTSAMSRWVFHCHCMAKVASVSSKHSLFA